MRAWAVRAEEKRKMAQEDITSGKWEARRKWKENWFGLGNWSTEKNSEQQDIYYEHYTLSRHEWFLYSAQGIVVAAIFVYVFYRSLLLFLVALIPAACYPLWKRKKLIKKQKQRLTVEFRDAILAMAAALRAGYAVENALMEAVRELRVLYGESMMVKELEDMIHKIRLNQPVEKLFLELGKRSGVQAMEEFAQVFAVAKKNGGELTQIVERTVQVIGDKIQVQSEIEVMTAARRYEQKIMNWMPIFLVLYLDFTSPGFFQILYTTAMGRVVMTGCLGVYVLAVWMAEKILKIEM